MPLAISSSPPHSGQTSPAAHFGRLDDSVGREVPAVGEIDHVPAGLVGARHPAGAGHDPRVDQQPDPRGAGRTQSARSDVALDERPVGGEVGLLEALDLCWADLCLQPFRVDVAVAGHSDRQWLGGAVGVAQLDDHVLHRVGRSPWALGAGELGVGVEVIDQGLDRRGVGRVDHLGRRQSVQIDRGRCGNSDRLGIGGVVAGDAAHVGVLAGLAGGEELLGCRAAHRARHRRHDHDR